MQYINKTSVEPANWANSFLSIAGVRIYDYRQLPTPNGAKQHLITEQNGLCAYCQKAIDMANSTIEHVIPYGQSPLISTSYHNLVAVCANFAKDEKKRLHCDKARLDTILPPIIFHKEFTHPAGLNCKYFRPQDDGSLSVTPYNYRMDWNIHLQVVAFIEILNLNHYNLKKNRSEILREWILELGTLTERQIRRYWQIKYDEIIADLSFPFRQFFLIYIREQL